MFFKDSWGWKFVFFYGLSWFFIASRQLNFGFPAEPNFLDRPNCCVDHSISLDCFFFKQLQSDTNIITCKAKAENTEAVYENISTHDTYGSQFFTTYFEILVPWNLKFCFSTMALGLIRQGALICMTAAHDKLVERLHLWNFKYTIDLKKEQGIPRARMQGCHARIP